MRSFILTVVLILAVAGTAAADGYDMTREDIVDTSAWGVKIESAVIKMCNPRDGSKSSAFLIGYWSEAGPRIGREYPGSSINCGERPSGVFVPAAGQEVTLSAGRWIKIKFMDDAGIFTEYFQGGVVKVFDQTGNFISFQAESAKEVRFIDVKLPLQLNSAGAFVIPGKGVSFSQNELMSAISDFYKLYAENDFMARPFSTGLLLYEDVRKKLLDRVKGAN